MSNSITKTGLLTHPIGDNRYLVENFSETNRINTSEWTIGGSPTISNGVITCTGTAPNISSKAFTLNPNDIVVFEFTMALPTPSTKTSGGGVYLGATSGVAWVGYYWDGSSWVSGGWSGGTNAYFLCAYNSTTPITLKNYYVGSNVDIGKIPVGYSSVSGFYGRLSKAPSGTTAATIRSGYNSGNSSMTITFSDFKVYRLTENGFVESTGSTGSIAKGYVQANSFIEY